MGSNAPALSKHSMAEPIAVSSWNTGSLFESLGLTVFLFLMRGRSRAPPAAAMAAESCSRFTHRLLELKNLLRGLGMGAGAGRLCVYMCVVAFMHSGRRVRSQRLTDNGRRRV